MNFRTTGILLVVLLAVGAVLFFTRDTGEIPVEPTTAKLLDVTAADVTRIAFTNDQGGRTVLERTDGKWKLNEPVNAPAEEFAAGGLVDALTALQSRGQVQVEPVTGLDAPRFRVELTAKAGKTIKLDIGGRSGAGDNLYVRREGQSQADVVSAGILDQLDKPLKEWRRAKLFDVSSTEIKQVHIASSQPALAMLKEGADWKITEPQPMPADSFAASDITSAVANLRAEEFVDSALSDRRRFGLDQPVLTVSFSTQAPSTQPTSQPVLTTIQFGRFDDVLKKNVFASLSNDPGVFKVSAGVLDSFRKKPLDLRDKRVATLDPEKVTRISITIDKAATTQPTTREASTSAVVLERTKREMGPLMPVTMPATTQAATQPVEPPAKWNVASKGGVDADDSKVDASLRDLNPLRATKFYDPAPTSPPVATIVAVIETTDAKHEIRLTDPGNGQPIVGAYNGLAFEASRTLFEQLETDFVKGKTSKPTDELPAPGPQIHPH